MMFMFWLVEFSSDLMDRFDIILGFKDFFKDNVAVGMQI